jgi:hypothetical protein
MKDAYELEQEAIMIAYRDAMSFDEFIQNVKDASIDPEKYDLHFYWNELNYQFQ